MFSSMISALLFVQGVGPSAAASAETDAHIAQLEAELAGQDYATLKETLFNAASADEARVNLDWLAVHFKRGSSPFVAHLYMQILTAFANDLPVDHAESLKGTALAAALYAASASYVEGLQCVDITARSGRMEQFSALLAGSELMQLPEDVRGLAALIALTLERNTWHARRERDDARFQCANGMAAMSAGIAAGQFEEKARTEGQIGTQIGVVPPSDFIYERRANEEWWPEAERAREQVPALLLKLARIEHFPAVQGLESEARR